MLNEQDKNTVQKIVGILLYYSHAVEATILMALVSISQQQAQSTQQTWTKLVSYWTKVQPTLMIWSAFTKST